jgi:hypothetical protein
MSDHKLSAGHARGVGHGRSVLTRQRDGFFTKHMLVGRKGLTGDLAMQIGRQADINSRKLQTSHRRAKIGKYRNMAKLALPKGLAQILTPRINNAYDAGIRKLMINIGMLLPHETETGEQNPLHG